MSAKPNPVGAPPGDPGRRIVVSRRPGALERLASALREAGYHVAIVTLGITLAFSADGWWEEREERRRERAYLLRIERDFTRTRDRLGEGILFNFNLITTATEVLGSLADPLQPVDTTLLEASLPVIFDDFDVDADNATYHEMVASGELAAIREPRLRRLLAEFDTHVAALLTSGDALQRDQHLHITQPFLNRRLIPELYLAGLRIEGTQVPPSPHRIDLNALGRDPEFWNIITHRLMWASEAKAAYERAAPRADSILDLTRTQMQRTANEGRWLRSLIAARHSR
jgi:hypothetical protein